MNPARRSFIQTGGGVILAGLAGMASLRVSHAEDVIDIAMMGTPGGAKVWFRPIGLLIQPGQTVRWTNRDPGNSHTSTAYHPAFFKKMQRIPEGAKPWDSGFLLPNESYSVTLTVPGVYDYYCLPHEHAGMVGRIIVTAPEPHGWQTHEGNDPSVPEAARAGFPAIDRIMKEKIVQQL